MGLVAVESMLLLGNVEPAPVNSSLQDPLCPRP